MSIATNQSFIHSCLKNCDYHCIFTSKLVNSISKIIYTDEIDATQPIFCPYSFSSSQLVHDSTRLAYPLYQEKKGSNQWKKISWDNAYTLIIEKLKKIYECHQDFSTVAFHKGNSNLSVGNYCIDEFFYHLKDSTKISPTGDYRHVYFLEENDFYDDSLVEKATLICIWGQNTVSNYKYLLPKLMKAKKDNSKILVIDPYYTKTAQFADYYLQVEPTTDVLLLELILQRLIKQLEMNQTNVSLDEFIISEENKDKFTTHQVETLLQLLYSSSKTVHLVGNGMKKHHTYLIFEKRLQQLTKILELEGKNNWIFTRKNPLHIFSNQKLTFPSDKVLHWNEFITRDQSFIDFLWISGSNPMMQGANSSLTKQLFYETDFVVTTDSYFTSTAHMSNLILPVTSFLEEVNLIINRTDYSLQLNEKSTNPYKESKSDFMIINELAKRLKKENFFSFSFPSYISMEDYLNKQWNQEVKNSYQIESIEELKQLKGRKKALLAYLKENYLKKDITKIDVLPKQITRSKQYPFYLITPHHPNRFNSQYLYLPAMQKEEPCVVMNENTAKKYGIVPNDYITIYNSFTSIEVKVAFTKYIHDYTLMIYNGTKTFNDLSVNQLVTNDYLYHHSNYLPTIFDTFVAIEKQ